MDPDAPLLGFIGRLDAQKGVDLIADNYEWLMEQVGTSMGSSIAVCLGIAGARCSWALRRGAGLVAGSDKCKRLMEQVRTSLFATEGQAAGAAWAAQGVGLGVLTTTSGLMEQAAVFSRLRLDATERGAHAVGCASRLLLALLLGTTPS